MPKVARRHGPIHAAVPPEPPTPVITVTTLLVLKKELPAYKAKTIGTSFDHDDVDKFTSDILLFWKNYGKEFPTWAHAMQIVGSFTPNSAAAERVFSMLKDMFGDKQMSALADMIQAALMLRYNKRKVG